MQVSLHTISAQNHLTVISEELLGFGGENFHKMQQALQVLELILNSQEFKQRVLSFRNAKGQRTFSSNQGLSNEQVYERIMMGAETLLPGTEGEVNLYLALYSERWSRVVGYTKPSINRISINEKFFRNFTPAQIAGNLAHEWVHKLGFDHRSAKEYDSVPYAIGDIVAQLGRSLLVQ